MDEKITAHSSKEEREKVLKEIRQLENRKKILENKQRNEERRVRTRRLIERGAILEGIFPLAPNLSSAEDGMYEGMFLFFDRKKRFKKGRLSCYINTAGDDRPKYRVSDKNIDGYKHLGRLVLTLRNYEE